MKKSEECIQMEIMVDELFESLEMGYLPKEAEIKHIMGYIDQKLVELSEKLEVPDFDEEGEA